MEEKAKKLARQLKVLANENRLLILYYLLEKPMTVGELNRKLSNITQSGLSQHLSILKAHDLLDSNKDGLNITYFVKDKKIHSILKMLKENCFIVMISLKEQIKWWRILSLLRKKGGISRMRKIR